MNIGFEAKRFFTNYTGLGNYCRFVIDALSKFQPDNAYFLYSPKVALNSETKQILDRPNIETLSPQGAYALPVLSALWRSWGVTKHPSVNSLSIYHGLSQELPAGLPDTVRTVVTVHDLIFLRYPDFYNRIDAKIYLRKVKSACENCDSIIAISEQTAEDIKHFLGSHLASKIRVIYQGCHPVFKQKISKDQLAVAKEKYALPDRFILNVGTIEERKNLLLLVRALSLIADEQRIPVVAVGRQTPYYEKVREEIVRLKLEKWFLFLYPVAFADLPAIYQLADLFVYPSFFEGFGIPLLEAITSEVPVITSTGSCFHEAGGPSSMYVDPNDDKALALAILNLLNDEATRDRMVHDSLIYIQRFEPKVIAADLMNVYQSLVKK